MNRWLIQVNPAAWDLRQLAAGGKRIRNFKLSRPSNDMAEGDSVVVWLSGPRGGVVGVGSVREIPRHVADFEPDEYWANPDLGSRPGWQVGLDIPDLFVDQPLQKSELRNDPRFANALILRMPGGPIPSASRNRSGRRSLTDAARNRKPVRGGKTVEPLASCRTTRSVRCSQTAQSWPNRVYIGPSRPAYAVARTGPSQSSSLAAIETTKTTEISSSTPDRAAGTQSLAARSPTRK